MKSLFRSLLAAGLLALMCNCYGQQPVWQTADYTFFPDSMVQGGKYVAKALSATEIVSDYQSPVNIFKSPDISFKFSINGQDNEMLSGTDHHFTCRPANGYCETPVITFGKQLNEMSPVKAYLAPDTKLKIRLDMRDVLEQFKRKGFYISCNGEKIYREDFKGVYVAGNSEPLIWDFNNLVNHPALRLHDGDGDGIYETTLLLNGTEQQNTTAASWKLSKDISAFPQYSSGYLLSDALYNMSLEEMIKAVEPDSTFRTGKEWSGVWTRDISYSIILSMACLEPRVAKYSLLRKVNGKKKIIQDTGTGGAWPVSTDRMIWAVAAWELYKVTGDEDWLKQAYAIIRNSMEDDLQNIYDEETGLVRGESSFLDWREESYPRWMQPADIRQSECLGTNAVHYEANRVLAEMAGLLHDDKAAARYRKIAAKIKKGINQYLWQPGKKYYGQFLYGRNHKILSPRSEALGEALCVLFDIADSTRQKQVVANTPVTQFGIPCIFPQIPGIPPYHNNAVWPFVQAFWLWASAKVNNEQSVMESISAIYRPAALFVTNKENFVADNGDFLGTQINSSNMLWSLSGNISIIHKVLFGMHFNGQSLVFSPFVPRALKGCRKLTNFKYRSAVLNIEMSGYGKVIGSFMLDGKRMNRPVIPASLKGPHSIKIILADEPPPPARVNKTVNKSSVNAPVLNRKAGAITWQPVKGAVKYKIARNGQLLKYTTDTMLVITNKGFSEYMVTAVDNNGTESFGSEPQTVVETDAVKLYEVEAFAGVADYPFRGFSGNGFSETSTRINTVIKIPVDIETAGVYLVDCRYANGNGPVNTDNKCAVRTLADGSKKLGTFVFPQRGAGEWSNWGYSNAIKVFLSKGQHLLSIAYLPFNENMNLAVNSAMLDFVRIIRTGAR
jgi:hypothetical protein